jgi:uncharacterized membrane protein
MNPRAVWAVVTMACVVLACVTVLLLNHVDPGAIISVIAVVVTPIISAVIYDKVRSIDERTNGHQTQLTAMINDLVEYVKKTSPPEEGKGNDAVRNP